MEFTEFAKDRLALTLKSGLLCAAMLMSATAQAHPPEVDGEEEPPQVTTASVSDPASEIGSTGTDPADQQKVASLSRHIQRRYQVSEHRASQIVQEAVHNGKRHQLEPELILAIIAVESTFKERAVSRVGARGLMQVMPGAHSHKIREIGGSHELFDPAKNIHVGSRILVKYLDSHSGNLRKALLSYNGSLGSRSSFPERVLRIYRDLRRATIEG